MCVCLLLLSCEYFKIWNNLGDLGVYLGSLCKYGMELKEKISHIEPQNHISSPQSDINPTSDVQEKYNQVIVFQMLETGEANKVSLA